MMNEQSNTRRVLRGAAILMIVFGAVCTLLYFAGLGVLIGASYITKGLFSGSKDVIGMALLLAAGAAELSAGILGVRAAKKPERAGTALFVLGWLSLLLSLGGTVYVALRGASAQLPESALALALGVVLPVVFLASARGLAREKQEACASEP